LARSKEVHVVAESLAGSTDVIALECDITNFAAVEAAVAAGMDRWGRIDSLVNCAAVLGATGEIWKTDPAEWQRALNVNLIGTYHTMRAVLPHMVSARSGRIVNFAGGGAAYGYPLFSGYAASKAGVVRLTETVATECAAYNVQVNVIAPGAIDTDLLRAVRSAGGEVRTLGRMEEAVALVVYLASGDSNHITGRFIHARDSYRDWPQVLPEELYTLRRVQQ
jgi:3-oxoacyl-[acyl-carrier protein] reductase